MDQGYIWQLGHTLAEAEKEIILTCMAAVHGDMKACASALDVSHRTIDNKMKIYREQIKDHEEKARATKQKSIDWLNEARKMPPQFGFVEKMSGGSAISSPIQSDETMGDMPIPERKAKR